MKLQLLPTQLASLLVTTALTAGFSSGCGKTNQAAGQDATGQATDQGTANETAKQAATAAAQKWLTEIDNGQYTQSWQDASAFFQSKVPEQTWESEISPVRKPLGNLESRNLESAQYATQLPGAPDGEYVVMRFDASFANEKSAVETVTFMLEKDGQWKSSGYYVK